MFCQIEKVISQTKHITQNLLQSQLPVDINAIKNGLQNIHLPGRIQIFPGAITEIYDVSHNPQSARLLAETLNTIEKRKVHAVFSALKDKDIIGLILPLKDCVDYWYPAQLDNKRAAGADMLLALFKNEEISVKICYNNPSVAFQTAFNRAEPGDLIVVYGSFFTVSHIRCMATMPN